MPIDVKEKESAKSVTQNLTLDTHELFTQLSVTAALVQIGPRRGVFLSFIDVVEKKTTRIWREWLAERAKDDQLDATVWADQRKTLGLKVRVNEKRWKREAPVLIHKDEDQAVSYSLELEGMAIFSSLINKN
ncbi:MAG: hypothetical protein Q9190_001810 [Brigantiaea leucoxantha]